MGYILKNTTYISSPIPVSLLVLPCGLKVGILIANTEASEALMRLDAVKLRAERGILEGTLNLGIFEAFFCVNM